MVQIVVWFELNLSKHRLRVQIDLSAEKEGTSQPLKRKGNFLGALVGTCSGSELIRNSSKLEQIEYKNQLQRPLWYWENLNPDLRMSPMIPES